MPSEVESLVVDTSAFIRNEQLQDFGKNIVTVDEVVSEIKSKRQLKRLVVLPYELQIKDVDPDNISFVSQFAKKSGDYLALSATDIKVIALTYQLEKELVGSTHLRTEPVATKSVELVDYSVINARDISGFYSPEGESGCEDDAISKNSFEESEDEYESELQGNIENSDCKGIENSVSEEDVPDVDAQLLLHLNGMSCRDDTDSGSECDQNDPCALDDDDAGWITPGNILKAKQDHYGGSQEEKCVKVACLTTDFAMQNVLKQIGLNVISLNGLIINEVRTFIFRCYSCFKTTPIMTKVFCPNCGNKTLKRVAVTVDKDGKEHIHINFRRPLTARGKRFPLPKFQGGKHSKNPILSEDQRVPQQRVSKIALKKNNPMDPDYIAGSSPFIMHDISTKSAILGVQRNADLKSWMRKNPNEVTKRRRKK